MVGGMVNNKILKLTNTFQVLNIKGRNNNCGHLKSHLLLLMQVECFSVYVIIYIIYIIYIIIYIIYIIIVVI